MKKLLILFFLMSISIFSETLENLNYSKGVLKGVLKEDTQLDIQMAEGNGGEVIIATLPGVNKNKAKLKFKKDQYVKKINLSVNQNETKIYFFVDLVTGYEVSSSKKEFEIKFSDSGKKTVKKDTGNEKVKDTKTDSKTSDTDTGKATRQTVKKNTYTIVVDAGHGGHDAGAVGNGYREKDLALGVALKLEEELAKDYNVIMTRRTDVFKTLSERPEIGNNKYADLFVSIHLNSASSSSANGTEVYYYDKKDSSSYSSNVAKFENSVDAGVSMSDYVLKEVSYKMNQHRSSALATDVLNGLLNNFALRDRGVKSANFAVLRGSNSPSVLIELGFMSNYGDVSQFVDYFDQERAARSIADAIRKNFIK